MSGYILTALVYAAIFLLCACVCKFLPLPPKHKFDKKMAIFIGRWQPGHKGHMWLISQKLDTGVPCLIMVRDIEPDEKNPFTTEQTVFLLRELYKDEDVEVMVIPDIESVNYGRGVGYDVIEHQPPEDIKRISATEIRNAIKNSDDSWKEFVDESIQEHVKKMLGE